MIGYKSFAHYCFVKKQKTCLINKKASISAGFSNLFEIELCVSFSWNTCAYQVSVTICTVHSSNCWPEFVCTNIR